MTMKLHEDDDRSPLKRALIALKEMRARVDALERARREPIAIVGIGCRFPGGATTPDRFWHLLRDGIDAISEVPRDRWDTDRYFDSDSDAPGKMNTRWGGFIDDVDRFDATFFGISPREAVSIDPQHRLLLETAWHALEDAGIAPDSLHGTQTGVFVGISTNDYAQLLGGAADPSWIDTYASLGNAASVAAGRLSYVLGLNGPAMIVDTACSSSLVAIHLACQSLRSEECGVALAGGVNLMLTPELTINFSKAHMMAADGRCKTFDASGDGYVRGEGCGVIVLKRLSDAMANGDRIVALIRGSAVNQDGHSSGLTAPNGPAQEAVIRRALSEAGIEPDAVGYIETHGTGTALGDPIELGALARVFGKREAARPLIIGAVKTNIGHTEAAAGLAGVIKAALALQHRAVPPNLHFTKLNPHIDTGALSFTIPTSLHAWESDTNGPRIAGVSSFGFSGTNAHVILAEAPRVEPQTTLSDVELLTISAKDDVALRELIAAYGATIDEKNRSAICHTANSGRSHFAHRIAVVSASAEECQAGLRNASPRVTTTAPRVGFLFTGQGSQYSGMGARLYETSKIFRDVIDRCGVDLAHPSMDETSHAQPALFAIEMALVSLWQSLGVHPVAVIGHSAGEIAAACAAGIIDLDSGMRLATERGRLMQEMPRGAMAAVFAGEDELRDYNIAAINGPANTVISDTDAEIDRAIDTLSRRGIGSTRLHVTRAFHSRDIDPMLDDFERFASTLEYAEPRITFLSNVTGAEERRIDARYWRRHARQRVRFADGIARMRALGIDTWLEIGPQPVLTALAAQLVEGGDSIASLRRGTDDRRTFLEAVARLYTAGASLNFETLGVDGRGDAAPLYPFQRQRYWPAARRSESRAFAAVTEHPLLGKRLRSPLEQTLFENHLDVDRQTFLGEHVVFGEVVVPAASHLAMAVAAARELFDGGAYAVEDVVFTAPLMLPPGGRTTQFIVDAGGTFRLFSLDGSDWTLHASGRIARTAVPEGTSRRDLERRFDSPPETSDALYDMLDAGGIRLGPAFRAIRTIRRGDAEALVELQRAESIARESAAYSIHPALLDACFQSLGATVAQGKSEGSYLPFSLDRITVAGSAGETLVAHVAMRGMEGARGEVAVGDVRVYNEDGGVVALVEGLRIKKVDASAIRPAQDLRDWFYRVHWNAQPLEETTFIPRASALAAAGRTACAQLSDELGLLRLSDLGPALEQLATSYAVAAMARLGCGLPVPAGTTAESLGVVPQHRRLFGRVVSMVTAETAIADPESLRQELIDAYPESAVEIDLLGRCGAALAGVLRGEIDPLQLLFPPSASGNVYADSPFARMLNETVAVVVARAAASATRRLRILEIGAGTGGTTQAVLTRLGENVEYRFTDISPLFLSRAQERFATTPSITYATLDIERDPLSQGFDAASFDIVIAANVMHATADLRNSLANAERLLAPGGLLVLLEAVKPRRFSDLIFGLTDGWWRFRDTDLRRDHPLITREVWSALLSDHSFGEVDSVDAGDGEQAILIARKSAVPNGQWRVAGDNEIAAALREMLPPVPAGDPIAGLVHVASIGSSDVEMICTSALLAVQESARGAAYPVWFVTAGAQPAGNAVTNTAAAALWGLGKVVALEHPELQCRRIDVDPSSGAREQANAIVRELVWCNAQEDEIAWRGSERFVARLKRADVAPSDSFVIEDGDACLITGAFGGLGLPLARWLIARGAKSLTLVGRGEPPADLATALATDAVNVSLIRADVGDRADVERVIGAIPRLGHVFHLAGALDDGVVLQQSWPRFATVFRGKAIAARYLDELTRERRLKSFVLFSTAASLFGYAGQSNHAAANAVMDAIAEERVGAGLPALSINWGAWGDAGEVAERNVGSRMQRQGAGIIDADAGFAALGLALSSQQARLAVIPIDWERFLAPFADRVPPFFGDMRRAKPSLQRKASSGAADLRGDLAARSHADRHDRLTAFIAERAGEILRFERGRAIDPDQALNELGLDSLMALELRNALASAIGARLSPTLLFNYPSVNALAGYLLDQVLAFDDVMSGDKEAPEAPKLDTGIARVRDLSEDEMNTLITTELDALLREGF
jgi:acyl transferase domain-containing protein/SAM-dependent methyltransferase/acyl carrier protein